ncbi:hypothetical protein NQ317_011185 [Molorchus minor]|uniref:Uncharacterized protein n=1 Tax=Molorchus minor TaxID=1323400 RepID=A0ABQ9JJH4_9CUCU|nr:hypothetical protein NQ317_011185 [Molorchus minor]
MDEKLMSYYGIIRDNTDYQCTIQPVRINILGKMPTDIARFLKFPNSELLFKIVNPLVNRTLFPSDIR